MKQLLQNIKTGETELLDVPAPMCRPGHVLIASRASLISVGTERMLLDFGKAGWIEKARQQPEKVKQVLDKIRTDGILPTVEAVFNKLDEPMPLGYCNSGVVLEVGAGVADLQPGMRVASNGSHAEILCVPRNLCARIPDEVSDEEAAFTVLGSIALQGLRLAAPSLGERFIVFGLGLVGLLTVQFLRANGCPVLAVDISEKRLRLAGSFGAKTVPLGKGTDPVAAALSWTDGRGVDGAIIAASAKGDEIVQQAASACRKRGRIVLVGVVDLNLRRSDFYEKEITFQVSCSYGPGRYDGKYEQAGQDYPFGFVRWTEQRNFEAVLETIQTGNLQLKELITHRIPLDEAAAAYDKVLHDPEALGVVLGYKQDNDKKETDNILASQEKKQFSFSLSPNEKKDNRHFHSLNFLNSPSVGVIGAGNFAKAILLPALVKIGANLSVVADINPVAAAHAARKFGIGQAVTDARAILDNPELNTVFVVVGHHLHSRFVCDALAAEKHVYVEKPLAINAVQLSEVLAVYGKVEKPFLMVGFNRRFSPHIVKIRELLAGRTEPLCMTMTVNAGFIPPEHWVQDPQRGGGRIIGEGCHFIDLLMHLAGSAVTTVSSVMVDCTGPIREDKMSILLSFADGSVGTIHYFANGTKSYPKETLEVFGGGRVIRMENFRLTKGYGFKGFNSFRTWRQDKGHRAELKTFIEQVASGGAPPIPFEQIVNVTQASFAAVKSAKTNRTIQL